MRPATALLTAVVSVVAVAAMAANTAAACNPEAPVHPVLDDQPYDSLARKVLGTQAGTIVIARLLTRMDLSFEGDAGALGSPQPVYQFDIREGWKQPRPRRLTATDVAAGGYSLFVANDGPNDEQVGYEVRLTPDASGSRD